MSNVIKLTTERALSIARAPFSSPLPCAKCEGGSPKMHLHTFDNERVRRRIRYPCPSCGHENVIEVPLVRA